MFEAAIYLGAVLIVAGIALLLIDVAHPGLFLLVPAGVVVAMGAIFLAAPGLFYGEPLVAGLIILAAGTAGGVAAIPIYQRLAPPHAPIATTVDTLTGMRAKVTVEVRPGTMKGKVRVFGEIWSATSEQVIPVGEEVTVTGGEGIILRVAPLSAAPKENP